MTTPTIFYEPKTIVTPEDYQAMPPEERVTVYSHIETVRAEEVKEDDRSYMEVRSTEEECQALRLGRYLASQEISWAADIIRNDIWPDQSINRARQIQPGVTDFPQREHYRMPNGSVLTWVWPDNPQGDTPTATSCGCPPCRNRSGTSRCGERWERGLRLLGANRMSRTLGQLTKKAAAERFPQQQQLFFACADEVYLQWSALLGAEFIIEEATEKANAYLEDRTHWRPSHHQPILS